MPLDLAARACVSHRPQQDRTGPIPGRCGRIPDPRWFALQSHPQAERWARDNLARAGYTAYLPLVAALIRDRHTPTIRHAVLRPLFPSYLFVRLGHAEPWTPVRYTQGIRTIVMFEAGIPAPCQQGAVEALQAGDAVRRTPTTPETLLRPLAAVYVASGPFRGHPGQVVAVNGARAVVTLMAFGGLINVHVAVADLRAGGE